jgi:serine/threonine protein kinase
MPLQPGDILLNGHYRIIRPLGRGGFGFVYLAQDTLLGDMVAVKELIPALVGDETMLKRFLAEARATMRLTHRRIVRTHNVFSEGGNYYIAMEYMPGGSLEERLRARGPLPVDEALRVAIEVCEGLGCAHEAGVVHCDLKPANILFAADGSAKVADFGIAHVTGEMLTRTWATPAGFVAGTLPYMSPEQADGVRDDPRIDVYALGAVLYRMLTGQLYLEFDQRETPGAQADNVYHIRNELPLPPSARDPRLPAWLDAVVLKALAKRPEDRFSGTGQLRQALLRQRLPRLVVPPPPGDTRPLQPRSVPPPPRRRPAARPAWFWPAVAGAAVLFVLLVFAVAAMLGSGNGPQTVTIGPGTAVALAPTTRTTAVPQPAAPTAATPPPATTPLLPTATATPTATPPPSATPLPDLFAVGVRVQERYGTASSTQVQIRTIKSKSSSRVITERRRGAQVYTDTSLLQSGHYLGNDGSAPWLPVEVVQSLFAGGQAVFNTDASERGVILTLQRRVLYAAQVDGAAVELPALEITASDGALYIVYDNPDNPYALKFDQGPAAGHYLRFVEAFVSR